MPRKPSNIARLSPGVRNAIRESLGVQSNDDSLDGKINVMTPYELLDAYLAWEGVIGYTNTILNILELDHNGRLKG